MHPLRTALGSGARRLAAALALSFAVLLAAGAASALAGPGVILRKDASSPTKFISGGQIAGAANAGGTYTLRERPGDPGTRISLRGVSMRGLLELAGFNPGAVRFVNIVGADGNAITISGPEINNPPFPDGPAIVSDEGGKTRFVKPARSSGGTSDSVLSAPGTALEMTVDGGSLLSIRASATPTTVKTGQTVTFTASVRFPAPGASYSYIWDFNDGTSGSGATVSHQFKLSGDLSPRVTVRGSGGSQCASVCEGTETVDVTVTGEERDGDLGTPDGDGGAASLGGTGTGGTGSGTGSGGGGTDDTAFGAYPPEPKVKPKPQRAERPEPHLPFSSDPASGESKTIVQGILLSGSGKTVEGALSKGAPAGNPKPQKGEAGVPSDPSRIGFALALAAAIMWLGALQERRRVRLRLA